MGSPADHKARLHEELLELLALDLLKHRESKSETKPKWLQLFESAGFAALVTVVIGGLAGAYITSTLQEKSKEREHLVSVQQLEHDRSLAEFNNHLERERKTVDEVFLNLGTFVNASTDLAALSLKEWNTQAGEDEKRRGLLIDERAKVIRDFTKAAQKWHSDRFRLGMELQLEHNNDSELSKDWEVVSGAVQAYAECADRWRSKYDNLDPHEFRRACEQIRNELDVAVHSMTDSLIALRNVARTSR